MDKRRLTRALGKNMWSNPVDRRVAGYAPWWSLLETVGRDSGEPRRTPGWRSGTARLLPDDDPRQWQRRLRSVNAAFVRLMGTDLDRADRP